MTSRVPHGHGKLTGIANDPRDMTVTGHPLGDIALALISLAGAIYFLT